MNRITAGLGSLAIAASVTTTLALSANAAPPDGAAQGTRAKQATDELPNAAEEKRRALREVALRQVLNGTAKIQQRGRQQGGQGLQGASRRATGRRPRRCRPTSTSSSRARRPTRSSSILAEFGDTRHPNYPDQDTDPDTPGPATFNGPLRNRIPAPDRTKDNSTVWQQNYDAQHYRAMYFGTEEATRSSEYYERQSSGRYSVDGTVTDWVKVPYNEARYGRSDGYPCPDNVCSNTWALIKDAIDAWVADQHAKGPHRRADQGRPRVL